MHYKAPDNSLHCIDSPEFEYLLPAGSVAITDAQHAALTAPPEPTLPDMVEVYNAAVQKHLDDFAASWRYVSILSASSYANSTIPQFKAEAEALILWRDQTWSACYAILAAVEAGTTPMPASPDDLIATLPAEPVRP